MGERKKKNKKKKRIVVWGASNMLAMAVGEA